MYHEVFAKFFDVIVYSGCLILVGWMWCLLIRVSLKMELKDFLDELDRRKKEDQNS
ncbi:MAG: hypothetical protein NTX59_08325 [Elusimicrobia bacterium]|nr:hypothetical protein [Elusimicrobiota bacterium]